MLCSRLFKICLDRRKLHFSWRWSTHQHSITPTILPSNGPSKKPCSYPSHYLDSLSSLTSVLDPSSRPLLAQTAQPTDILTGNLSFSPIFKVCQERRTTCFSWREPILKLVSLMRSMEFVSQSPVLIVNNIEDHIGQMPHEFPSIFSCFPPEFQPAGRVGNSGLVAPEATLLSKIYCVLTVFHYVLSFSHIYCG